MQSAVPDISNSMRQRTDDCIVLLPTGNRTGTVKLLSLATGKVIAINHFTILPLPTSEVGRLTALAKSDGRSFSQLSQDAVNRAGELQTLAGELPTVQNDSPPSQVDDVTGGDIIVSGGDINEDGIHGVPSGGDINAD